MRSNIDWNEIVPRLKKPLRDTLMLEAVLMLTDGAKDREPKRDIRISGPVRRGERSWLQDGDGKQLNMAGRYYRINRKAAAQPTRGKIGEVWKKVMECKNDFISYEGLATICTGQKAAVSATICQLWARRHIDVDTKKVVQAI